MKASAVLVPGLSLMLRWASRADDSTQLRSDEGNLKEFASFLKSDGYWRMETGWKEEMRQQEGSATGERENRRSSGWLNTG